MRLKDFFKNSGISAKITATYALCFLTLLCIINLAVWFGTNYALYEPAEKTIAYSMKSVQELLSKLEKDVTGFDPDKVREPLVPGVVLRVVDDEGNIFIDTDATYPSIELFEDCKMKDPPHFAKDDFDIALIEGRALVYRARMDYFHAGEHVTFYFFRTITSMKHIFDDLIHFLIFLDILGIIIAIGAGNFISRKVLNPITTMTNLAREIAYGKMDGRIPLPPANDELTELAKTFNEMLDRLQGGINQQQNFVSTASHELRTPAAVIASYIELVENCGAEDKEIFNESVEAIRSEAQNMKNLLENLLFLTRTDQQRQQLHKVKFDLSNIVDDVVFKMKKTFTTHEIILSRNDFCEIFGDVTAIRQMLRIFLDNATKYTPVGGKITVSSKVDGKNIFVKISDTGIGISEENWPKIFSRFFRVDTENLVRDANGSGLGLSIAKWIADNHEIKISVESRLGKGTTFILEIPSLNPDS